MNAENMELVSALDRSLAAAAAAPKVSDWQRDALNIMSFYQSVSEIIEPGQPPGGLEEGESSGARTKLKVGKVRYEK